MSNLSQDSLDYSIILQINEADPYFPELLLKLNTIFDRKQTAYEIIVVANGSGHYLRQQLDQIGILNGRVKAYALSKGTSATVCLRAGFEESRGKVIILCGSHQQITDESLMQVVDSLDGKTDLVNSWRCDREDSAFNKLQSRTYNWLVGKLAKSSIKDLSSAIKVFRREVLEETELYGNMCQFLPILAAQKGFKIKEIECKHHQWSGNSGFVSASDYLQRILDIINLVFLTRFTKKPLRFFSLTGLIFFLIGLTLNAYVIFEKLFFDHPIGGRFGLLFGMILMVIGVQVASTGLLGEIIAFTHGRHRKEYSVEKEI